MPCATCMRIIYSPHPKSERQVKIVQYKKPKAHDYCILDPESMDMPPKPQTLNPKPLNLMTQSFRPVGFLLRPKVKAAGPSQ